MTALSLIKWYFEINFTRCTFYSVASVVYDYHSCIIPPLAALDVCFDLFGREQDLSVAYSRERQSPDLTSSNKASLGGTDHGGTDNMGTDPTSEFKNFRMCFFFVRKVRRLDSNVLDLNCLLSSFTSWNYRNVSRLFETSATGRFAESGYLAPFFLISTCCEISLWKF